jgi:electron transfer flavoprotein alpha subunit
MANMRAIMPALQKAKPAALKGAGLCYQSVQLPKQTRETRIVKNLPPAEIAQEIAAWMSDLTPAAAPASESTARTAEPVLVLASNSDEVIDARSVGTNVRVALVEPANAEAAIRASGATLILAPHTSAWARVLPAVAVRLNGRIDTHATGIAVVNDVPAVTRWFYRQRMEAVLTRSQRPWIVMLDPGCFAPWTGELNTIAVEPAATQSRTKVTGIRAPQADEQTIRLDAKLLFVAGAGWTKKQPDGGVHGETAEKLILGFLKASQASLGGSKSLVDMGGEGQTVLKCMTHLNQIGQTGATPRHPKGLSTCCHGEEPHVVGWRFITERRAINLDANCGWARGKADVLYVADAFAVMSELNKLLGA